MLEMKLSLVDAIVKKQIAAALVIISKIPDVNFTFSMGPENDRHSYSPLLLACQYELTEVVKALLAKGANALLKTKGRCDYTPLHLALRSETPDLDLIEMLVNAAPQLREMGDHYGATPLHYTSRGSRYLPALKFMLSFYQG